MPLSIAYIELFPTVLAASPWGHQWFAKRVDFCSDNKAVVEALRSHTSRDSNLMVLLRHLSLLAPGTPLCLLLVKFEENQMLCLTPFLVLNFGGFHQLAPYASPTATPVTPLVLDQLPVI